MLVESSVVPHSSFADINPPQSFCASFKDLLKKIWETVKYFFKFLFSCYVSYRDKRSIVEIRQQEQARLRQEIQQVFEEQKRKKSFGEKWSEINKCPIQNVEGKRYFHLEGAGQAGTAFEQIQISWIDREGKPIGDPCSPKMMVEISDMTKDLPQCIKIICQHKLTQIFLTLFEIDAQNKKGENHPGLARICLDKSDKSDLSFGLYQTSNIKLPISSPGKYAPWATNCLNRSESLRERLIILPSDTAHEDLKYKKPSSFYVVIKNSQAIQVFVVTVVLKMNNSQDNDEDVTIIQKKLLNARTFEAVEQAIKTCPGLKNWKCCNEKAFIAMKLSQTPGS